MDATTGRTDMTLVALKALADEKRLEMTRLLAGRELCVCEIAQELGVSDALVSHHIKRMREAGLVLTRRVGQWMYCRLSPEAMRAVAADIDALAIELADPAGVGCAAAGCGCPSAIQEGAAPDA